MFPRMSRQQQLERKARRMSRRRSRLAAAMIATAVAIVLAVPASAATPGRAPSMTGGPAANQAASATDWPQFRGGPSHTGNTTAETQLSAANVGHLFVAWSGWTDALVQFSSPAVSDGVVYVAAHSPYWEDYGGNPPFSSPGYVYAFPADCVSDEFGCEPLWKGPTDVTDSSPAVADGVVYVGDNGGTLYAFAVGCAGDGSDCSPLWTAKSSGGGAFRSSPAVAGGVVYIGSADHRLYAFPAGDSCDTGGGSCTPLWTGVTGGAVLSSPVVVGGVVYVGSYDGKLYAFPAGCATDGSECQPTWTGRTGAGIFSSPAVAGGVVYAGSDDGRLYAFKVGCATGGGTCAPLWTGLTGASVRSSPAVADGVVYVGSNDGRLYAFKVGCNSAGRACSALWTGATNGSVWSSPAVANGVVYVGSNDGSLYAFAAGCGTSAATCPPLLKSPGVAYRWAMSSPAVADGRVYIGSEAFSINGDDVTPPSVDAPRVYLQEGTTLGHGSTVISWDGWDDTGTSAGTGIAGYELQQSVTGGAFKAVALPTPTTTSLPMALKLGVTTRFRVRATDGAGNRSSWATGSAFTPTLYEDTNSTLVYSGTWKRASSTTASGGTTTYATKAGAKVSLTFTGSGVAFVAPLGPTRGSVAISIDGGPQQTMNLHSSSVVARRVAFTWGWYAVGKHTITVRVLGTAGHPRVDVDAFEVLR